MWKRIKDWFATWRRSKSSPTATAPSAAQTSTPYPEGVIGAHRREVWTLDGVPVPDLESGLAGLRTPDGRVIEVAKRACLTTVDGLIVDRLDGLGRCSLCVDEAQQHIAKGTLDSVRLSQAGLCSRKRLRMSTKSGIPLCPRHRRIIVDAQAGKEEVLSTLEEEDFQLEQQLKASQRLLLSILLPGSQDA